MPSSHCPYGHRPQSSGPKPSRDCLPDWLSGLPAAWRDRVVAPGTFRVFREYEVPARRLIGYDEQGQPCYCVYDYRLIDLRSDDDEEFYQALAYGESVTAWRLNDARWLVHRCVEALGEEGGRDSDFSVEEWMPR